MHVAASLYGNPIHRGHIAYLQAAKKLGDHLTVIVNSDHQVSLKGSVPLLDEVDRWSTISSFSFVDYAVISHDNDETVCQTLQWLHGLNPVDVFANGGDRTSPHPKEDEVCKRLGITQVFGVGGSLKAASSSAIIKKAFLHLIDRALPCK